MIVSPDFSGRSVSDMAEFPRRVWSTIDPLRVTIRVGSVGLAPAVLIRVIFHSSGQRSGAKIALPPPVLSSTTVREAARRTIICYAIPVVPDVGTSPVGGVGSLGAAVGSGVVGAGVGSGTSLAGVGAGEGSGVGVGSGVGAGVCETGGGGVLVTSPCSSSGTE